MRGTLRYAHDYGYQKAGDPVTGAMVGLMQAAFTPATWTTTNARGEYALELSTTVGDCRELGMAASFGRWNIANYEIAPHREIRCVSAAQRIDLRFYASAF